MANNRFGFLSSSYDPEKLAATATGLMKIGAGGLVYFGLVSQLDADVLIRSIGEIMTLGIALWGAIETVFGILRKAAIKAAAR